MRGRNWDEKRERKLLLGCKVNKYIFKKSDKVVDKIVTYLLSSKHCPCSSLTNQAGVLNISICLPFLHVWSP